MAVNVERAPRAAAPARTTAGRRVHAQGWGWLFSTPFFILYVLFLMWPIVEAARTSLFNDSLVGHVSWRGLKNYGELLGDSQWWLAMWHTLLFTLLSTPPLVLLALGLALMVNRIRRLQWVFRLTFFAPFVLPVSVVVLIWNWLYQPDFGLINSYLNSLGLGQVNWLGQPFVAMIAVVLATVWWTLGFNFVLYLAGLQEIPTELYDAAATDGATTWQQMRAITIPLLRSTTIMVVMLQVIASLKVFDQIYLLQNGTAGPDNSTRPAIQYIYETGFTSYRLGYASALSFVFFLAIVVVSLVLFRLVRVARRSEA